MAKDLMHYFEGDWTFERDINISETGEAYASATGTATITPHQDPQGEAQYHESGKVTIKGATQSQAFFRKYRYVFTEERLDIYFDDQLNSRDYLYQSYFFHEEINALIAIDKHVCNLDLYEGKFEFINDSFFIHTTIISGPQKDYTIVTRYRR